MSKRALVHVMKQQAIGEHRAVTQIHLHEPWQGNRRHQQHAGDELQSPHLGPPLRRHQKRRDRRHGEDDPWCPFCHGAQSDTQPEAQEVQALQPSLVALDKQQYPCGRGPQDSRLPGLGNPPRGLVPLAGSIAR